MNILLLGAPGSGKGTQGLILSRALGLPKFATGDLLRNAVAAGLPLGLQAKALMDAGHLVGDDLILGIVRDELDKQGAPEGVIFDGVVRTIPQAVGLAEMLAERGARVDKVIFLDVDDAEVVARIERRRELEGRRDDDPATVATRLRNYREQTAPVLDWYEGHGGVVRIAATGSIEAIAAEILRAVEEQ